MDVSEQSLSQQEQGFNCANNYSLILRICCITQIKTLHNANQSESFIKLIPNRKKLKKKKSKANEAFGKQSILGNDKYKIMSDYKSVTKHKMLASIQTKNGNYTSYQNLTVNQQKSSMPVRAQPQNNLTDFKKLNKILFSVACRMSKERSEVSTLSFSETKISNKFESPSVS